MESRDARRRAVGLNHVVRRFGTLASQYAADSGDPILAGQVAGQVAGLRSRTAFDRGQYLKAADVAAAGQKAAHPGQLARLAAYEAEAWAALGKDTKASDALATMREHSPRASGWTGWTEGDQMIFSAVTFAELGRHGQATSLALDYAHGDDNDLEGVGWAHATAGRCLLAGDRPDPVAAAHQGVLALGSTAGPNMSVVRRSTAVHTVLRRRWPELPEVDQLGDALKAARAALPVRAVA